jgi:hypothetical protein
MNASSTHQAGPDLELTDTRRIVAALVALSQSDPWGEGATLVLSAVEKEIARHHLNKDDSLLTQWRESACRARLCAAERHLRSEAFREEAGLRPWGLFLATTGAMALADDSGSSPLHWAAENNTWYAVPESAITAEAMLQMNAERDTPFAISVRRNALGNISQEALLRIAWVRTRSGETILHHAASQGLLLGLPPFLKSEELLSLEDADGCSVLERHQAAVRRAR